MNFGSTIARSTQSIETTRLTHPGGNNVSTFGSGSFVLENASTGDERITQLSVDLSSAFFPDTVFDPNGTAGCRHLPGRRSVYGRQLRPDFRMRERPDPGSQGDAGSDRWGAKLAAAGAGAAATAWRTLPRPGLTAE